MADIFISYASEDRERAKLLAEALKEQGWSVWWDRDLPFGRSFDEVIRTELRAAGCVIALWTESAAESLYVIGEARDALSLKKLISVFLTPSRAELPYDLQAIHGVELFDWNGDTANTEFQRLVSGITTILGQPPQKKTKAEIKLEKPETADVKPPKPRKRNNALKLVAVAGVIVLLIAGIWLYISESRDAITNSIGMKFVLIPEGKFVMGSPPDEQGRKNDERQHEVNISKSFYLQVTEVSQRQWKKVMEEDNPSSFTDCGDDCPVEQVSWKDAQKFIRKLNQIEGTNKYRLPTEAEWEYACRAGTTTPFFTGDCISTDQANYNGNYSGKNCPKGQYREKTVKVGSLQPNAWGLYDMHGNVWEWCQDWYHDYPSSPVVDPKGTDNSQICVMRGGSWNYEAWKIRSASRGGSGPDYRVDDVGFRVARDF
jgi:formylglycine-generating enzyme required for sulfatase activity